MVPRGFPYVFIITGKVSAWKLVYGPTFVDHEVFVLGGDQKVFDSAITFIQQSEKSTQKQVCLVNLACLSDKSE